MAGICLHCDKKIGLFKKPIEGLYCSYDCRSAARERQQAFQENARIRRAHEEETAARTAEQRMHSEVVAKAEAASKSVCPKCGAGWVYQQGGGSVGLDHGACLTCGFATDFLSIESCPHCRCHSWVVLGATEGRCPRCKTRSRQSA